MPLLQPGSRSSTWQARNARVAVAGVEEAVAGVEDAVETVNDAVATVQGAVETAQGAANDAMDAADEAKSQVGLVFTFQQVRDSYSDDGVLAASAVAGVAAIQITAHERHYLNSTIAVMVDAGSIADLIPAKDYQVFYDDPMFEGGDVDYQASLTIEGSLASLEAPARHYVGLVTTPASGGTNTEGGGGPGRPYWKPGLQEQVNIE